jgi:hypothetical protein
VNRSSRRRGQSLVVVGALLGALVGIILGLAVGDAHTSTAVGAPTRARAAAVAATPPTSQPTTSQPTGSGDWADGDASTGLLRSQSSERPGMTKIKADRNGKRSRHREDKGSASHANGKPGKGK